MKNEKILRRLVIKSFHVNKVEFGDKNTFVNNLLKIDKKITNKLVNNEELVKEIKIDIIKPKEHNIYVNTIMDVIPISTKVLGKLGEGITHTFTGVYVMLTGVDEDGRQMHEFGSSEGILKDQMAFGKAGTPSENDYIIHVDVLLKGGVPFDRKLPMAAFRACDFFIESLRTILKSLDGKNCSEVHEFFDKIKVNAKKVLIIKQIAGQGAMYDNMLFSSEPSGLSGGTSIIDVKNVPMIISPNEYRDGALRSMT